MSGFQYSISPDIFRVYPGYVRGVVTAHGVHNGTSPAELEDLLRREEDGLRSRLTMETLAVHERIAAWREAYRKFGAKPSEYRSSVEALTRRVLRGDALPAINTLVDIGNLLSLRHLMPVGGHAIDHLAGDITLRFASGEERFVPFGSDVEEHPLPGEVVFTEGNIILTRRWTWRQAQHTLTVPGTTAIEFNVDGLPPIGAGEVEKACIEVVELVEKYCGGTTRVQMLDEQNPVISLLN